MRVTEASITHSAVVGGFYVRVTDADGKWITQCSARNKESAVRYIREIAATCAQHERPFRVIDKTGKFHVVPSHVDGTFISITTPEWDAMLATLDRLGPYAE